MIVCPTVKYDVECVRVSRGRFDAHPHCSQTQGEHVIDFDARALGFLLGLGDLAEREVCHGFPNGCGCVGCVDREELAIIADKRSWAEIAESFDVPKAHVERLKARRRPVKLAPQPWEIAA